jgi:hypothetical protein
MMVDEEASKSFNVYLRGAIRMTESDNMVS